MNIRMVLTAELHLEDLWDSCITDMLELSDCTLESIEEE